MCVSWHLTVEVIVQPMLIIIATKTLRAVKHVEMTPTNVTYALLLSSWVYFV